MAPRFIYKGACAAGILAAVSGCATVEYRPSRAMPEISVQSAAGSIEHVTPPALPAEESATNAPAQTETQTQPLSLTVEGALVLALQHNQNLSVQEVNPALQHTFVSEQRSVFDPVLVGSYTRTEDRLTRDFQVQTPLSVPDITGTGTQTVNILAPIETKAKTMTEAGSVGVTQHLPTGMDISLTYDRTDTELRNSTNNPNLVFSRDTDSDERNLNLSITQQLLRGGGLGVNLASLRQAKLDTLASDYELRGFTEDLVSQVEQTYWDCILAQRQIKIYEESLALAQAQADEVEERIRLGKLPEVERAGAVSEVAQRKSSLIDAHSTYDTLRLSLLRLVNPNNDSLRPVDLNLQSDPITPQIGLSGVDFSIQLAQRMRPDLNQARLQIKRDDLEVVKTKNGLLPQLDLFLNISKNLSETNYAASFEGPSQDEDDDRYTTQVGAQFSYPLGNRAARARDTRSDLSRTRNMRALANMTQLVEQDVRAAYIEVGRAWEQIPATTATRELQEQTMQAEVEKFRLGRSTVLLVTQAQRDLLTAQIGEVQARTAYLKSIVNLYRLEGSLLERRGIRCPGRDPVALEESPSSLAAHYAKDENG
ncbi:MAG: TolC family protein [Candidatus Hydrogenedentes bacterium]|nr:TolC family protein [Candidatus Hydrogenedentota bacterium]